MRAYVTGAASSESTTRSTSTFTSRVRARERRGGGHDHGGSGGVYFAAEVNLVDMSMTTGFPNMVNRVVPYVALDMISYSSYGACLPVCAGCSS